MLRTRFFIFFCLSFLTIDLSLAQQDQLFNTYTLLPLAINPAYAGSRDVVSISGIYRKKPLFANQGIVTTTQQYFNFDMPIANDKIGIGFQAYNAEIYGSNTGAILGNLGLYADFAYRIILPSDGVLSLGSQVGLTQIPIVSAGSTTMLKTSIGLGAFYKTDDWYVGLSIPNMNAENYYAKNLYLNGGYLFTLKDLTKLKVGSLVRSQSINQQNSIAVDYSAELWLNERFGIGFNYMNTGSEVNSKAFLGILEVQLAKFRFSYTYDFEGVSSQQSASSVGGSNQGFHQLMLRYEFDAGNGKSAVFRYF